MSVTTGMIPGMMLPGATPPAKARPAAKPARYKSPYDPSKGGRILSDHRYATKPAAKKRGR